MRETSPRSARPLADSTAPRSRKVAIIGAFSTAWSASVIASVYLDLRGSGWAEGPHLTSILLPFGLGSFVGSAWGIWAADAWGARRPATTRFCLFFVLVAAATLLMTALLFYLPYRAYFAQWHADFLSVPWAFQVLFTGLSTAYLFLTTGLNPLVPWPIILLMVVCALFSGGWLLGHR